MRFTSTITLGVAVSAFVDVATAIKYANVKITPQTAQFKALDSQSSRVTVSHTLPLVPNSMSEEGISTMHVHWKKNATKPCSECLLKYASVTLRGIGSSFYTPKPSLDKFTLSIEGYGRKDAVCGTEYPDGERVMILSKAGSGTSEKYFFTREDRTAGVWLGAADEKMSMSLDVGNIARGIKNVVMDITFEFIPADKKAKQQRRIASDFKTVKGVFLDIAACGSQQMNVNEERDGLLSGSMREPWVAPFSGRWMSATGHDLSEGGTMVEVSSNGKKICSSYAVYPDGDMDNGIERYEGCTGLGAINQGDAISMKALYEMNPAGMTGGFAGYVVISS